MSSRILTNILENIVINKPSEIAIECNEKSISYQELNHQANYIANFLLSLQLEKGSVITVYLNDKTQQIFSLLGIFKSGNIYLPFDTKFGHNHWDVLLDKIKPKVFFVSREYIPELKKRRSLFETDPPKIIILEMLNSQFCFSEFFMDSDDPEILKVADTYGENANIEIENTDSNYIFFTSGTTGKPKAVLGSHISLSHFIHWEIKELDIVEPIRVSQITSLSFDASLRDIFVAFITAGTLCIPDQAIRENPNELTDWLSHKKINLLHCVPTVLRLIMNAKEYSDTENINLTDLKYILLAGEKLYAKDIITWRKLFGKNTVFYNLYGATESTLVKTFYKIESHKELSHQDDIPVGHPISNTLILILNEEGSLCKINEKGRVYIKTPFLSKGYFGDLENTNKKFIQNPLNPDKDIIYDTGDLGKYDNERNLILIGREDGETKINGVRVDINSIESTIHDFEGVEMAKCVLYEQNSDSSLICFFSSQICSEEDLKQHCFKFLSVYEQPLIIKIDNFPTNANGKIDVDHLKHNIEYYISEKKEIIAPSNNVEERLLTIWIAILEWNKISIRDNFFSMGGHSIKAFKLLNKISKEFNVQCSLNDIYSYPTIEQFAAFLDNEPVQYFESIVKRTQQESYLCSNSQKRMWLVSLKEENSSLYNVPIHFKLKGKIDINILNETFRILVEKHDVLRTQFKFEKGALYQYVIPMDSVQNLMHVIEDCTDIDTYIHREINTGFNLGTEIPIRIKLLKSQHNSDDILVIIIHHIAYDGWSKGIIFKDIVSIYEKLIQNENYNIDPLELSYKDYVYWHEKKLTEQEVFWKSFFDTQYTPLDFPLDFPRSKMTTKKGTLFQTTIEAHQLKQLKFEATKVNISLTDYFIGAVGILLNLYTEQSNITIGTITSGRNHLNLENIVGSFINYIPITINLKDNESLKNFFSNLKLGLIDCYNNQNYPYDLMVENFIKTDDNLKNPIFDIIIVFHHDENNDNHLRDINEIQIEEYNVSLTDDYQSKLDIKFDINFAYDKAFVTIEYNTDLFEAATIEALSQNLMFILNHLFDDLGVTMSDAKNRLTSEIKIDARKATNVSTSLPIVLNDKIKAKIISSFTSEQIKDQLIKTFKTFNIESTISFGAYNQIINELSQETLNSDQLDYLIVFNRYEDYWNKNESYDEENIIYIQNVFLTKLKELPENLVKLIGIFPADENKKSYSIVEKYNESTIDKIKKIPNCFVLDFRNTKNVYPNISLFDDYKNDLAHIPFTDDFFYIISLQVVRTLLALRNTNPLKVIALDCDNTLWKGICGESTLDEIIIDGGYKYLQEFVLQKYKEGFLVVLISKNNEEDVFNVFDNHPDMILRREHILTSRINWNSKSENIIEIAEELNLNINSFIFIDDNPWECQQMMIENPEVLTLLLPEKEVLFSQLLARVIAFDKIQISEEDRQRTTLYKKERERKIFSANRSNKEFIKGLNLKVSFRLAKKDETERVYQLLNRTNQFVLNKLPRSNSDISTKIAQNHCYVIHVSDRFGDYGLTGVLIFDETNDNLIVESFNLSCRILGKEIENCILDCIKNLAKKNTKKQLILNFEKTPKNDYFQEFLMKRSDVIFFEKNDSSICKLSLEETKQHDDITLYLEEDIPKKQTFEFYFDHTGIAVKSIEESKINYASMGFSFNEVVFDPLQNCYLTIGKHKDYNDIELVQGYDTEIIEGIKTVSGLPYHICYRIKNIDKTLQFFTENNIVYDVIRSPRAAILFGNKKVVFLYVQNIGIIELLEDVDFDFTVLKNTYKSVAIFTNNVSKAKQNFELLGYKDLGDYKLVNDTNHKIDLKKALDNELSIMLDFTVDEHFSDDISDFEETADREELEWIDILEYDKFKILHSNVYKVLEVSNLSYFRKDHIMPQYDDKNMEWVDILTQMYINILGDKFIDTTSDFSEMGGNSLLSTQILSRLYYNYDIEINILDFFKNSSIEKLSQLIYNEQKTSNKNEIII
ncbi:HAD-IIIC family phosphatase [[Flexibacter] sp. ATCC 35103]|uniref:HAD-IIIC family phosphatase n=1 Tax=[Flexibacter] sp. ATCC 35103 TaxID=1937528 RepID=UPI0009C1B72C|nr:HAD-IIIC family phosphatase [[Flexibacter] sp. ATCC 35103]AQX14472.1 monobactam NRPS scaffold 3 [[Flexibacter] sp. ATCC 35103]OMQ08255.1 hypothetical protein BXU01_21675 [[Flexibacter] sp. ATCC 35103]